MKKGDYIVPPLVRKIFYISLAFYLWYLISTLLLPISEFINLPNALYITIYKISAFPVAMLGFVICVSLISSIAIIHQFQEKKTAVKLFLIEGFSFFLYFIIPIIATILLLTLIIFRISNQIPSETRITYFLEDLFLFTSALFLLTAILNIATHKIISSIKERTKKNKK